jgi:hypothetical protein
MCQTLGGKEIKHGPNHAIAFPPTPFSHEEMASAKKRPAIVIEAWRLPGVQGIELENALY